MDIKVTFSLVQEEHDDLLAFLRLRLGEMTVATYVENLSREQLRQVLDGFRAWKIAEVPSAAVTAALAKLAPEEQKTVLDLLGLEKAQDGRLIPVVKFPVAPTPSVDVTKS